MLNPKLLVNQANTQVKDGNYGKAISLYLKAKQITPRMPELNNNLSILNQELRLTQPSLYSFNFMSFSEALILLVIFNTLWVFRKKLFKGSLLKILTIICFMLSIINFAWISYEQKAKHYSVITSIAANTYSGDSKDFAVLYELLNGQIVEVLNHQETWSQIKTQEGVSWIQNSHLVGIN